MRGGLLAPQSTGLLDHGQISMPNIPVWDEYIKACSSRFHTAICWTAAACAMYLASGAPKNANSACIPSGQLTLVITCGGLLPPDFTGSVNLGFATTVYGGYDGTLPFSFITNEGTINFKSGNITSWGFYLQAQPYDTNVSVTSAPSSSPGYNNVYDAIFVGAPPGDNGLYGINDTGPGQWTIISTPIAPAFNLIFNGNTITNTLQTVGVGQPIQLTVMPPPTGAQIQSWNIAGQTVGGFVHDPTCPSPTGPPPTTAPVCTGHAVSVTFNASSGESVGGARRM